MPIRAQLGVRDCGHWNAPFQDAINLATLGHQAVDCRSCAVIMDWILTTYASRCDSEEIERAIHVPTQIIRRKFRWIAGLQRLGFSCVRGVWFARKFLRDIGWLLLLCGFIAIGILSVPVLFGISIGVGIGIVVLVIIITVLALISCLGKFSERPKTFLWAVAAFFFCSLSTITKLTIKACGLVRPSVLRMLGANVGRTMGDVAPPIWTELPFFGDIAGYRDQDRLSDIESRRSDDLGLPDSLKREGLPLIHPFFRHPHGSSAIRISSSSTAPESPEWGCNIYQHTYNPRGPVGSLVYFVPGIGQKENHPTHFLSLGAGNLFLTAWPREQERWATMRSRLSVSLAKPQGQEYDQIDSFVTARHSSGGITPGGAPLPTRLLDLGDGGGFGVENTTMSAVRTKLSTATVKLVTTPPDARGRYLALSHRWGDDEDFKLTASLLSAFQRDGVPFSTIPKTFQDALAVTRLLRHRYLWIDALCIVQDDVDDWTRESARMAAVYCNASCTISAHTARNSRTGFLDTSFQPPPTLVLRSPRYLFNPHRSITHLTLLGSFADQVAGSFLSRRGWVFQERVLSQQLLHFVRHHTFFEDACGAIADDIIGAPPQRRVDSKWSVMDSFHGSVYWYRLVERYSRCSLTYENDRLPAIAGLAQTFSEMNDPGTYRFGLWGRSVHLGLLWLNSSGRPAGRDDGSTAVKGLGKDNEADRLTLTSQVSLHVAPSGAGHGAEAGAGILIEDDQSHMAVRHSSPDLQIDQTSTSVGSGATHTQEVPALPSWSWAYCRGAVSYPNTLSDSMKSDLLLVEDDGSESKEPNAARGPARFHGGIEKTQLLTVDGLLVELTLVYAKANTAKQGMPFFDPPIQGLYSATSAGNQFGSWVSLDNPKATSDIILFPKLSCLRVCSLREAENTFVLRYETSFYFILLEEVGGTSDARRYRRVGVGVTGQDYWAKVERRRVRIE